MLYKYPYPQQNVVPGRIVGFTPAVHGGILSLKKDSVDIGPFNSYGASRKRWYRRRYSPVDDIVDVVFGRLDTRRSHAFVELLTLLVRQRKWRLAE